ncbi:MAG: sortase, partial [Faecalibacterium sp.]|nr:sortase [Faecalibacterium sp.]
KDQGWTTTVPIDNDYREGYIFFIKETNVSASRFTVVYNQPEGVQVGGASTHAVISAHRGLPSAKLFTNLDQLEVGDTFTITVLDRVLTYEVDKISIVLPTETDELKIAEGKDYVTLMTCTPYGINTHRLLVRGRRIETPDQYKYLRVTAEALKIEPIIVAPIMALPMLLILLIGMLISTRKPKKTRGEEHEKH